ncbi:hypothetical protein [Ideonella sp. YS5]|uniref:hypothetical protein n=1 Tax=Ideonella sp. YS5 TaxID=3453714 RepID=UPI003EEA8B63
MSWPDLPAEFRRTAFRRLLSEMSQRHLTEALMVKRDGLKAAEVRALLQLLASRNVLDVRETTARRGWRPVLAGWLRRLTA